jgi:hypothetical protein
LALNTRNLVAGNKVVFLTLEMAPQHIAFEAPSTVHERVRQGFLDGLSKRPKRVPRWLDFVGLGALLTQRIQEWGLQPQVSKIEEVGT